MCGRGRRMGAGNSATWAEASCVAKKETVGKQQQEDRDRLCPFNIVQSIILYKKLGIKYSTKGAVCAAPQVVEAVKKLSTHAVTAALAAALALVPDSLQVMAEENT